MKARRMARLKVDNCVLTKFLLGRLSAHGHRITYERGKRRPRVPDDAKVVFVKQEGPTMLLVDFETGHPKHFWAVKPGAEPRLTDFIYTKSYVWKKP